MQKNKNFIVNKKIGYLFLYQDSSDLDTLLGWRHQTASLVQQVASWLRLTGYIYCNFNRIEKSKYAFGNFKVTPIFLEFYFFLISIVDPEPDSSGVFFGPQNGIVIYQPSEADPDRILTRNRIRMAISPNGKKRRFTLHKLFFWNFHLTRKISKSIHAWNNVRCVNRILEFML